jgi:putative phosphoesterase
MRIGILSDTHGNLEVTARAAGRLQDAGVAAVFHCGDIGGMDVLAELAGVFAPDGTTVHAVLGNVDVHSSDWKFFPTGIGVILHGRFGDIACGEKRIALLHSDDARRFRQTVTSGEFDLVLSGHTHELHDYTQHGTRCINPGTAGRGSPDTCAVLDMDSGKLTVLKV